MFIIVGTLYDGHIASAHAEFRFHLPISFCLLIMYKILSYHCSLLKVSYLYKTVIAKLRTCNIIIE